MGCMLLSSVTFSVAEVSEELFLKNKIKAILPEAVIKTITKSPLPGFHQVQIDSGRVFYISEDGNYLLQGYLFDIKSDEPKNLTTAVEEAYIADLINNLDRSKMIIYPAKGKTLSHITVFTDTSCPYCHKLHQEIPELNAQGIEVRYLAYPRDGLASKGFDQLQDVWCAQNKIEAMNSLMLEQPVAKSKRCNNPVVEQYVLARKIGIRGTPAIILEDGRVIPGYQPVSLLAADALMASKNKSISR